MSIATSQEFKSRLERDVRESADELRRSLLSAMKDSFSRTCGLLAAQDPPRQQDEAPTSSPKESVSLGAYLRTVWAVLWTAFLHPFTTTVIDARTGKVLRA